jgi:hypothetical protein
MIRNIAYCGIITLTLFVVGVQEGYGKAQLLGTPSSIDKMTKLFGMNSFIDQEARIMKHAYAAELHGNRTAYNMLNSQNGILTCIDNTLLSHVENDTASQEGAAQAASSCDGLVTDALVSLSIGNNQTILNWAHLYLKARGIQ